MFLLAQLVWKRKKKANSCQNVKNTTILMQKNFHAGEMGASGSLRALYTYIRQYSAHICERLRMDWIQRNGLKGSGSASLYQFPVPEGQQCPVFTEETPPCPSGIGHRSGRWHVLSL